MVESATASFRGIEGETRSSPFVVSSIKLEKQTYSNEKNLFIYGVSLKV